MNRVSNVLDMLLMCYEHGDSTLFLRENGEITTYQEFVDDVLSIGRQMLDVPERFLVISASDPVLYAKGYFASVISGHVACLERSGSTISEGYKKLGNKSIIFDDFLLDAIKHNEPDASIFQPVEIDALCTIAMSSGTVSGISQLAGLSQKTLITDVLNSMQYYRYHRGQRCVHILPYWHMFGVLSELFAPLLSGAVVCIPNSFMTFFKSLKRFRPDSLQLTPAIASQLVALAQEIDFQFLTGGQLKKVLISGAPIEESTCRILEKYGVSVCTAYGLTECSPCVSIMPDEDIHRGTSGKVLKCIEVNIADDNEILVKGSCVMLGYVSSDGSIQEYTDDGWLHTGDLGFLDKDGFLTVIGRKSSILILSTGIKYVPERIEKQINEIQYVTESIVGLEEIDGEQLLTLTIVHNADNSPDQKQIERVMQDEGVYTYRCVFQLEPLRRNAMGKLIR